MTVQYDNEEFEFSFEVNDYTCDLRAYAEHFYEKGCMYSRDGDPGYSDDEDLEVTELEINGIWDADGNEVEETPEIKSAIMSYVSALDYDCWS